MAAPTRNLVITILFSIKLITGKFIVAQKDCFCDDGCYKTNEMSFRVSCCSDICENAEERMTSLQCHKYCPCYTIIKTNKAKNDMVLKLCENNLTTANDQVKIREKKIKEQEKRIQELEAEVEELNKSHKELSESRQFIAALVTPLCLFGVIAVGFLLFTCAREPRGTVCQRICKKKGSASAKPVSTLSTKSSSSSFSHLLRNSKLSEFKQSAEGKDNVSGRSAQSGSASSSLRPACLKSASTGGSSGGSSGSGEYHHRNNAFADGLLLAKSVSSARSSTRSTISTAPPGFRPPHLEGESHNRSRSPCSHLALPRQPEVIPGEDLSAHSRAPFQPLFQPMVANLNGNLPGPHIYQLPLPRTYPAATTPDYGVEMAGGDAATVCLRNLGPGGAMGGSGNAIASAGTAVPSANRLPHFGEQPTNIQTRRESEAKKTKLDSSAYKLASLNIADRRINVDAAPDVKISD